MKSNSNNETTQVKSARDALALLARKMYEKFGAEALPLIEEVCEKLGQAIGKRMLENLPDRNLKTVGKAFAEGARRRNNPIDIIEISDTIFHLKGYRCNLGLKNTHRELCKAMMAIDQGIFEAATGKKIKLNIAKTLAGGDPYCEVIFQLADE